MIQGLLYSLPVSAVCVVLLVIVRRFIGYGVLKDANEVSGVYLTIIGTIYAVILAFMVFAVWTDFQAAQDVVEKEANALVTTARLSYGYPSDAQRAIIENLLAYGHAAIDDEWTAMAVQKESATVRLRLDALWGIALHANPDSIRSQAFFEATIGQLIALRESRRSRLNRSKGDLPRLLWDLLLVGGGITLLGALLIGTRHFAIHAVQTVLLAMALTFVLASLAQLNKPFQGSVRVGPDALIEAVRVVDRIQKTGGGSESDQSVNDGVELPPRRSLETKEAGR